jgi:hypothetical protein
MDALLALAAVLLPLLLVWALIGWSVHRHDSRHAPLRRDER